MFRICKLTEALVVVRPLSQVRCLGQLSRHLPKSAVLCSVPQTSTTTSCQSSTGGKQSQPNWLLIGGAAALVIGGIAYAVKQSGGKDDSSGQKKSGGLFQKARPVVELPKEVPYLIVGAGTAAYAAYRAIRAGDATAKVLLLGEESQLPYMRPPLSKELWYSEDKKLLKELKFKQWNGKERSLFYEKDGFYCQPKELPEKEHGGVAVALEQKVVRLDVKLQIAYLDNGKSVAYNKCLIATGGKPKNLPIFADAGPDVLSRCTLYRTVDDFWKLDKVTQSAKSIAIVGGGFMGSELACALGKRGKEKHMKVIQTFPEKGNMGQVLPEYLSKWATEKVKKEGVDVIPGSLITACSFNRASRQIELQLDNGSKLSVDHVVVAVGLEPNTELATTSGLEVDERRGGFLVNAELEARTNVWVAGDAACFYDTQLGRRRVEHHDHAVVSGRLAGENMTGSGRSYWHQSMFWSDLGPEVGYEAIGLVTSSLPTVGVFARGSDKDTPRAVVEATGEGMRSETEKAAETSAGNEAKTETSAAAAAEAGSSLSDTPVEDYGKGIIFYLRNNVVVGVIMWNVFNKMAIARQLIKEGKSYSDLSEVAKLFNLYGEPVENEPEKTGGDEEESAADVAADEASAKKN